MNDLSLFGDKRMTVKEVAKALGVADRTVRDNVARLFPGVARNGATTYLDEEQVTIIKQAIERSGRNDLANVRQVGGATTDLEMKRKAAEVMSWLISETDRLRAELANAAPKVESFDALMRSERTMSITDAAKHFGLHPRRDVFEYLWDRGYLTIINLPTQSAIDAGYLALRETKAQNGNVYPQAVVLASQLETWRTRVIPQIEAWRKSKSSAT